MYEPIISSIKPKLDLSTCFVLQIVTETFWHINCENLMTISVFFLIGGKKIIVSFRITCVLKGLKDFFEITDYVLKNWFDNLKKNMGSKYYQ